MGLGENKVVERKDWEPYFDTLFKSMVDRNIFATQRGYFENANKNVRPGDAVYLVYNSTVPFIPRKGAERERIRLISPSTYVDGLMKGEALKLDHCREEEILLY